MIRNALTFSSFAALAMATILYSTPGAAATFHGTACTADCSGHKAGYAWAMRKGVLDPATCQGRSPSFVEGCRIAARERQAAIKAQAH